MLCLNTYTLGAYSAHAAPSLSLAAMNRDEHLMRFVLMSVPRGPTSPIDYVDGNGISALSVCVCTRYFRGMSLLLDAGASVDIRGQHGFTMLHLAVSRGDTGVARFLLRRGANPNVRSHGWITPLMDAARYGHKSIVQLLLSFDADIDERDLSNRTALDHAIDHGQVDISNLLVAKGAGGISPLHEDELRTMSSLMSMATGDK
jgi:ankyrin repeat protein